jgi:chorismate--pyruvate lyase
MFFLAHLINASNQCVFDRQKYRALQGINGSVIAIKFRYVSCSYELYCHVMLIKPEATLFLPVNGQLPSALLPWVTHQQSLTERLQAKAKQTRLQVLGQRWGVSNWWDKYVLNLDCESVLHREILMWAGQDACWYARTIIPKATYLEDTLFFDRLENESLGALIFNEAKIKRVSMTYYPIGEQSIEYHWLDQSLHCSAEVLWVRMSSFTFNGSSPFFLIEILLPALERFSN